MQKVGRCRLAAVGSDCARALQAQNVLECGAAAGLAGTTSGAASFAGEGDTVSAIFNPLFQGSQQERVAVFCP